MGGEWLLPLYGLAVGLLVGLTGMGGGVLMMPLLVLGLGMPATAAVGTDLAYSSLTKLAGAWQHWRQGTVDSSVVRDLAIGSVPATLVAVALLYFLRDGSELASDRWLNSAIAVMLVVAASLMLFRVIRGHRDEVASMRATHRHQFAKIVAIGALGGFLVGLTSIGSGSVIIALLVLAVSLRPERLVGTDVAHAFLLVTAAALAHIFFLNDVDFRLASLLLIGSIPGVIIGSRLMVRVPRRPLQIGLAGLLLSTAAKMLVP